MANTKWKDYLLKSGLPLEYEVKQFLDSRNCVSSFEYSYLKPDENSIINEFSFDIDSAFIEKEHFFKFLIECKYRDPSTSWFFLPSQYGGPSELGHTSFLHPNDHFTKVTKFPYRHPELPVFAKACQKGIEITSEGQNPKTITQAATQISYAMAEIIADDMVHQIEEYLTTSEVIFYNIPIIITTANLYRINENVTIDDIKSNDDILQIATKEDCIVLETKIGKDLEKHNRKIFQNFLSKYDRSKLNHKLKSFNTDIDFVCSVISEHYCPQAILVIQHTSDNKALIRLFDLLNDIIKPSKKTKDYLTAEKKRIKESMEKFKKIFPRPVTN